MVQVQILLPETLNEGFGVVRTLVRDSTDAPQAAGAETFLDSDGTVSQDAVANQSTVDALLVRPSSSALVSVYLLPAQWPHELDSWLRHASDEVDPESIIDVALLVADISMQRMHSMRGETRRCCWQTQDGGWHMIGLTTHPSGGKGYQMYLDGALVADMAADGTYNSAYTLCSPGSHADLNIEMQEQTS